MIRPLWPFYLKILSETIHLISWSAHSGLPFFYKERLVGECWLGFRSDSSHVWVVLVSKVSPIITSRVFYISSKHILVNILCWTSMLHKFNVVKWKCWCQMIKRWKIIQFKLNKLNTKCRAFDQKHFSAASRSSLEKYSV